MYNNYVYPWCSLLFQSFQGVVHNRRPKYLAGIFPQELGYNTWRYAIFGHSCVTEAASMRIWRLLIAINEKRDINYRDCWKRGVHFLFFAVFFLLLKKTCCSSVIQMLKLHTGLHAYFSFYMEVSFYLTITKQCHAWQHFVAQLISFISTTFFLYPNCSILKNLP